MKSDSLELVLSKVALGLFLPENLPNAAVAALEDGCASPSLRVLAALTAHEVDDAWPLFDRALAELNLPRPRERDAVMHRAREAAKAILSGPTTPSEGARRMYELDLLVSDGEFHELDAFIYALDLLEDRQEDRQLIEEDIVLAARELVG
ncbi:MAG: hypothetical protein ACE5F1_03645 [Planctomycetota bacterium]